MKKTTITSIRTTDSWGIYVNFRIPEVEYELELKASKIIQGDFFALYNDTESGNIVTYQISKSEDKEFLTEYAKNIQKKFLSHSHEERKNYINSGYPTDIWCGVPHGYLLKMCANADADAAAAMSNAAALMLTGDCTNNEWTAAMAAMAAVEKRLCELWEQEFGEPIKNRLGRILGGGTHPALSNDYKIALDNLNRMKNGH